MKITIRKKQYTLFERLFLVIWTIYSFNYAIFTASELPNVVSTGNIGRYISYATIVLQLLLLLYRRYELRKLLSYLLILLIAFLVEISVRDRSFFVYILFIILAQEIDYDKLLKFDIKLKVVLLFIIFALCLFGITDNYIAYSSAQEGYKQAIGFNNFNTFTCYALTVLCEWLCLRYRKMRWFEWCIILILWFVTLQIGGGRSSAYTFILIMILFFLARMIPRIFYTRISKIAFTIITPFMCVFSFVAIYLYSIGNSVAIAINEFVTNRLAYAARIIGTYGIKLFGQEIELVSTRKAKSNNISSLVLDNAYARCAVCWGIIVLILFIVLYCFLFRKLLNSKRVDIALLSLFFVILGFGESYILNVIYNTPLLCLLGLIPSISKDSTGPLDEKENCEEIPTNSGNKSNLRDIGGKQSKQLSEPVFSKNWAGEVGTERKD